MSIEVDPAWSPDGKQLALSSNRGADFDIYVLDLKSSRVSQKTRSAGDEGYPRWSPDGRKLGFSAERDDVSAIGVINVDGTGLTTLRKRPENDAIGLSDWAPDGLEDRVLSPTTRHIPPCMVTRWEQIAWTGK